MANTVSNASMGWRYVAYEYGAQCVWFRIEPMARGRDVGYVPTNATWEESAPDWAKGRYREILAHLKGIPWNRKLHWRVLEDHTAIWAAPAAVPGSLESTPGGKWLEDQRFFHPD